MAVHLHFQPNLATPFWPLFYFCTSVKLWAAKAIMFHCVVVVVMSCCHDVCPVVSMLRANIGIYFALNE